MRFIWRRSLGWRCLAAALVLAALGGLGCSSLKATEDAGAAGSAETSVDVRVAPPTVRSGETATITVQVTNTSAAAKTLQFTSSCRTSYEFLDADGKVVGSSVEMCAQVMTALKLGAGGSFTDVHTWGRRPVDAPQLKPGTYRVRGVLLATGEAVRSAPTTVVLP
jgi:hypothetical protein